MVKINLTGVTPSFFLSLDMLFRKQQVYFAIQLNAGAVTAPPVWDHRSSTDLTHFSGHAGLGISELGIRASRKATLSLKLL